MNPLRKPVRYWVPPVVVIVVLGIVAAMWLRGSSGITIRGNVSPLAAGRAVLGAAPLTYAGCAQVNPAPGAHIAVTDTSGKVIGHGALGTWSHATIRQAGVKAFTCYMPFTVSGLPHEPHYGFEITGVPGTFWVSDVSKPVLLNLSRG